ncbi:MAG TPA: HrcA family transcriptional regulator, partial [Oscillospiraceae bacterium]|nr:HrcA family transcriptional regulator [Oscillospiraceae bacterium]
HTPADLIPSPGGYRLYVNELMARHKLSVQETERINAALSVKMAELDRVIDQVGRAASQLTQYPAFAVSAGTCHPTVRRYDLVPMEGATVIALLVTDGNTVRNRILQFSETPGDEQLSQVRALLRDHFTGLTAAQLTPALLSFADWLEPETYGILSLVVSFAVEALEELVNQCVHMSGIPKLLEHPEYRTLDKAQPVLSFLEEDARLSGIPMPEDSDGRVKVIIGPENLAEALRDTSVVVASYDIGDGMHGLIGVVGPTRMDYAKVTARLSYFAESLTRMFGKNELPPDESDKEGDDSK